MNNYTSALVTVTTSETGLVGTDINRSALILFNQGTEDVQWYFGDNSTHYFVLAAGTGIHFPAPPINTINAVTSSGTAAVSVMEA